MTREGTNNLPERLEGIARAIRDCILEARRVAVMPSTQATAMAAVLEGDARELRRLMRHAVPERAAAPAEGALPDGVASLDAARRRRRRLRLVSDGDAA